MDLTLILLVLSFKDVRIQNWFSSYIVKGKKFIHIPFWRFSDIILSIDITLYDKDGNEIDYIKKGSGTRYFHPSYQRF